MARVASVAIHVAVWTTWLHHHWLLLWHTSHQDHPQHPATTRVLSRALTAASLALVLVIFHGATHLLRLLPSLDQALAIVATVLVILLAARIAASIQRWRLGNSEFLTLLHTAQSLVTLACSFLSCLVADNTLDVDTQARFLSDLKRLVLAYAVLVVDDCRQCQRQPRELFFDQELLSLLTNTERAALRASGLDAATTKNKPLACVVAMWLRCRMSAAGFSRETSECPLLLPHVAQVMELHYTISSLSLLYENVVLVWRDPPIWSYWTRHSPLGILGFLVVYALAQIPSMQLRVTVWVFVWGVLLFGLDALAQSIESERFTDKDALEMRLMEMQHGLQGCLRAYFQPLVNGLETLAQYDRSLEPIEPRGSRGRRRDAATPHSPHSPHSATHRSPSFPPADDLSKPTFKQLLDLITTDTTASSPATASAATAAHCDDERRPLLGERPSATTTVALHRGHGLFLPYDTNRIDEGTTDEDDDDGELDAVLDSV